MSVGGLLCRQGLQTHLQLCGLWRSVAFTVQIVRVESQHSLQHLVVFLVHQFAVSTLSVPRVERVVANHRKSFIRNSGLVLDDVVKVLVVAPGKHHIVHANTRLVDAELGLVDLVVVILVVLEGFRAEDDTVVKGTAHWECVSHDIPLAVGTEEEQQLSKIVDQTDELHPARLAIFAKSLCSLQQMCELRFLCVGVTFIDESVQFLESLPDRHLCTSLVVEILSSLEVEGCGLQSVLLGVEGLHTVLHDFN